MESECLFSMSEDNAQLKTQALVHLLKELKKGENCGESYSEEDVARILDIEV